MKRLKIVTGEDNPILRQKSKEIKKFDASLKKFTNAMRTAMYKASGLGLAAPQVGENIRMFITTLNYETKDEMLIAMVNPVILSHGDEKVVDEEGCLSLPKIFGKVPRFNQVVVQFQDLGGNMLKLELKGLNARVVQHELDHLDGILFIDKMLGKVRKAEVEEPAM